MSLNHPSFHEVLNKGYKNIQRLFRAFFRVINFTLCCHQADSALIWSNWIYSLEFHQISWAIGLGFSEISFTRDKFHFSFMAFLSLFSVEVLWGGGPKKFNCWQFSNISPFSSLLLPIFLYFARCHCCSCCCSCCLLAWFYAFARWAGWRRTEQVVGWEWAVKPQ